MFYLKILWYPIYVISLLMININVWDMALYYVNVTNDRAEMAL